MAKQSTGLLLYRRRGLAIEVFLVHPGGPFWAKKDQGAWSIPKGEFEDGENPLVVARREFRAETGFDPRGACLPLTPRRQRGGKLVHAWALAGDCDPAAIAGNDFTMEWPPHSGRFEEFPEVDRAAWFDLETARGKIHRGQLGLQIEVVDHRRAGLLRQSNALPISASPGRALNQLSRVFCAILVARQVAQEVLGKSYEPARLPRALGPPISVEGWFEHSGDL